MHSQAAARKHELDSGPITVSFYAGSVTYYTGCKSVHGYLITQQEECQLHTKKGLLLSLVLELFCNPPALQSFSHAGVQLSNAASCQLQFTGSHQKDIKPHRGYKGNFVRF